MRNKTWLWPVLSRIERDGGVIKAKGGALCEPAREPAVWRRIAALASLKDVEPWFLALTRYGPLIDTSISDRDEQTERRLWEGAIEHLAEVAELWKETGEGSNLWRCPRRHRSSLSLDTAGCEPSSGASPTAPCGSTSRG